MYRLIAFLLTSILLVIVSRKSLRVAGSHGFYRFFAWECIAALFFLNVNVWFRSPGSWNQVISWVLLAASLVPLFFGVRSLIRQGKPMAGRQGEAGLLAFEKTTVLVTTGIYRYIRHPLYSSLFLLTWGIFCKAPSAAGVFLAICASLLLLQTARADEAECIRFFGPAYQDYMKRTSMFLPYLL